MSQVGANEARTQLSLLLKEVERGESVTITRRGWPVARLVPVSRRRRRPVQEVIRDIREFRRGHTLSGITTRELIEEGRRC